MKVHWVTVRHWVCWGSPEGRSGLARDLHWLPVNQRIKYKLCLMMHQIHIQQCLDYTRDLFTSTTTGAMRSGFRSAQSVVCPTENPLSTQSYVNAPSVTLNLLLGTHYLPVYNQSPTLIGLNINSKLIYSRKHFIVLSFQLFLQNDKWLCNVCWSIV